MRQHSLNQQIEVVEKRLKTLTTELWEDSAELRDELAAILVEIREAGEVLHQQPENRIEARMTNSLLRSLIDVMPAGVIVCDRDGAVLMTNSAAEAILGGPVIGDMRHPKRTYTPHRLDGSPFPAEEMPLVQAMEGGETVRNVEILIRRLDGEERMVLAGAAPVKDEAGDLVSGVKVFQDVTEQVQTRQRLREMSADLEQEHNLLQIIMENTPAQLAYLDPEFNFVRVNPAYVQGTGYDKSDLIGHNHFELFPHKENQAIFEQVRDTGERVVYRARPFDFPERPELGTTYWDWTLAPVMDRTGNTQGLVLSLLDVTKRERDRVMVGQYVDRLRVLHEVDQAILAARSIEEVGESVLSQISELLGCVWASIVLYALEQNDTRLLAVHAGGETQYGKGWHSAIDLLWAEAIGELAQGRTYAVEDVHNTSLSSPIVEMLQAEGIRAYVMLPLIVEADLVGSLNLGMRKPGYLMPEQMEIAEELASQLTIGIHQARLNERLEQHAAELETLVERRTRALRNREARLQAIFDNAALGIAITDLEGQLLETNRALQAMLLYSGEELRGMRFAEFTHPEDVGAELALYHDLLAGKRDSYAIDERYIRKDGQVVRARLSFSLIHSPARKPQSGIALIEDVTEQRAAEEALIQAEKLSITGRLAASLAHEINNPMQSVIGCLGLAQESLDAGDEEDVRELLQIAAEELDRAAETVSNLRDLNRPSRPEDREPMDVNLQLEHVLMLTENQCRKRGVEVEWRPAEDLPTLILVPDRMSQVFLNLVLNALDAMPKGGRLRVSTGCFDDPAWVQVTFADTGQGIVPDALPHLFDPFYTTKSEGLGLGLYITRNIIEEHGGRVEVESLLGEGTTFTVWLPVQQDAGEGE
jgi:PAS domain S-box-containing protein